MRDNETFDDIFLDTHGFTWTEIADVGNLAANFRKLTGRLAIIENTKRNNLNVGSFTFYYKLIRRFIMTRAVQLLIFQPTALSEYDWDMMFAEPPVIGSRDDTKRRLFSTLSRATRTVYFD